MTQQQLGALGLLLAALAGGVLLHQVALREGAALGLDTTEIAALGLAVTYIAGKRTLTR